jgi:Flp pilus assembly pilin Flp
VSKVLRKLDNLFRREEGQTLTEYSLILFFIAVACIITLTALGVNISAVLQSLANTLGAI